MNMKEKFKTIASGFDPNAAPAVRRPLENRTAPGQMARFSVEFQELDKEAKELREQLGKAQEIDLSLIDDSPFQVRTITDEDVQELVTNLRENPLATPIVVRKVGARYQLIAGHRRKRAFEALARTSIPAVVAEMTDEDSERAVIFDNLLAPTLPDYEKYLGLAQLRERHGWTYDKIAERAGISKTLVSYLFSFARLPAGALAAIVKNPRMMSAGLAAEFAKVAEKAPEKVEKAIAGAAAGEQTPAQALAELQKRPALPQPAANKPVIFKRGRQHYAELSRRGSTIVVKLAKEGAEDTDALHQAIQDLIKEHSSRKSA